MKTYIHYLLSPLFYLCVAFAGRAFTAQGISEWYPSLLKPSYTPPGSVIGTIWTVIYILSAISLIIFVNRGRESRYFWLVIGIYILNGIINAAWSYIFFTKHLLGLAVLDSALIGATVAILIILIWPSTRLSALLLLPYLLWVSFATYLTYDIYRMN